MMHDREKSDSAIVGPNERTVLFCSISGQSKNDAAGKPRQPASFGGCDAGCRRALAVGKRMISDGAYLVPE